MPLGHGFTAWALANGQALVSVYAMTCDLALSRAGPRPRVGITIGDKRQQTFDTKGMPDFRLQVALGTAEEWQSLLKGEDGLVLLRGQWIEVDRDKLKEALDHWKMVQARPCFPLELATPIDLQDSHAA